MVVDSSGSMDAVEARVVAQATAEAHADDQRQQKALSDRGKSGDASDRADLCASGASGVVAAQQEQFGTQQQRRGRLEVLELEAPPRSELQKAREVSAQQAS